MKRIKIFVALTAICLIVTSCSTQNKSDKLYDMDSKAFLEQVSLPDKLSIDIDVDKIQQVNKAKTYQAAYLEFDQQKLKDAFIKNPVTEEKIWAEGPQLIASSGNVTEYLNIYDGGKSYGVDSGRPGGFSYSYYADSKVDSKLGTVATTSVYDPSFSEEYLINTDYSSGVDLSFLSYEDALADIREIFKSAGVPQFDIDETYSLDLETMKTHFDLYNRKCESLGYENEWKNTSWSKEDECYIFSLRQLVDQIPIINREWYIPDGAKNAAFGSTMPITSITLVYDKTGLPEISVYGILRVTDEISNNRLISFNEAMDTLIKDYSLTILEEEVRIIDADLCYLNIPKGDSNELVPGWLFRSAKEAKVDGYTYTVYKYDVVNAVTGELYQDRW